MHLFGGRYVLLRNEELRADPAGALGALYDTVGRPVPDAVAAWARENVRPPETPYAPNDCRWFDAFRRLEMEQTIADAGYPELVDEDRYERPSRLRGLSRLWR